jgi:hypothetical protein
MDILALIPEGEFRLKTSGEQSTSKRVSRSNCSVDEKIPSIALGILYSRHPIGLMADHSQLASLGRKLIGRTTGLP